MKKLFYGFILIQFFILAGGQNQVFAVSGQQGHLPLPQQTSPSGNPAYLQESNFALIKAVPAPGTHENFFFDFLFFESEEEDDKLSALARSLQSIFFHALKHALNSISDSDDSHRYGEPSSHAPFSFSDSPPYLIFQVFRI